MSGRWFRLYAEFATDPKVQTLSETLQRRFIMLLCLRCSGELEKLSSEEVAFSLRISAEEMQSTLEVFRQKKLIDGNGRIRNWDKRQFKSDDVNSRVARWRAKRNSNVTCNNDVTASDTETDSEVLEEPPPRPPPSRGGVLSEVMQYPGLDQAAFRDWVEYRSSIRKTIKTSQLERAARAMANLGPLQAAAVKHSIDQGYQGLFVPHDAKRSHNSLDSVMSRISTHQTAQDSDSEAIGDR